MAFFDNDRWRGDVRRPRPTRRYVYTLIAWRDLFASWRDEVSKKHAAGVDIALELIEGRNLIDAALAEATGRRATDKAALRGAGRQGRRRRSDARRASPR